MTNLNDLHTFTFTKEDWNLISRALIGMKEDYLAQSIKVDSPSPYWETLRSEASHCEALNNDILLKVA